jgi:hypothetical protein
VLFLLVRAWWPFLRPGLQVAQDKIRPANEARLTVDFSDLRDYHACHGEEAKLSLPVGGLPGRQSTAAVRRTPVGRCGRRGGMGQDRAALFILRLRVLYQRVREGRSRPFGQRSAWPRVEAKTCLKLRMWQPAPAGAFHLVAGQLRERRLIGLKFSRRDWTVFRRSGTIRSLASTL